MRLPPPARIAVSQFLRLEAIPTRVQLPPSQQLRASTRSRTSVVISACLASDPQEIPSGSGFIPSQEAVLKPVERQHSTLPSYQCRWICSTMTAQSAL